MDYQEIILKVKEGEINPLKAYEDAKKKVSYIEKIAQAGGGVDTETGEEITAATKINGKTTIFIKQL